MSTTFEDYAARTSADCVAEYETAKGNLGIWIWVLIATLHPYVMILAEAVWPVSNYIQWQMDRLEAAYSCAAAGGEAGFVDDETWTRKVNYVRSRIHEVKAYANVPYIGMYKLITIGLELKDDFALL